MTINVENPIISYSKKGTPFAYERLFFATIEPYILEFKNCRLDRLTEDDQARCLARIYKRMEVNGVPVLEFFKEDLDEWKDLDQYHKTMNLAELIARDIFCCFDRNRDDENGDFCVTDRIYCIVDKDNRSKKDFIVLEEYYKGAFGRKIPTEQTKYFNELMDFYRKGRLPKVKD